MSSDERPTISDSSRASVAIRHTSRLISFLCSCAALTVVFFGLIQLDLPIIRYVRTLTTHREGEQLTIPWMVFTSDAGDWIGEGSHLIAVSLVLLAAGWTLSKPNFKTAGIDSLFAHGLAALLSNGLKHLLGRPRPKFVHSGEWQFTPSWTSGLDSFPSGHTTASFAVATVLAKRFPGVSVLVFALAAFVGLSRVLRGSHFPTDVFGGAVLGVLSGSIASAPWKDWRASLEEGVRQAALGTAAVFAILWTLARHADDSITGIVLIGLGIVAIASGLWLRWSHWIGGETEARDGQQTVSTTFIAYGLACITTAPLVIAAVGFACLGQWTQALQSSHSAEQRSTFRTVLMESALIASLLLVLTILVEGRGVLPFQ